MQTENNKKYNIAILSASGRAGRLITDEALSRGFSVSAFVRDSKKLNPKENLNVIQKDILNLTAQDLNGFDVIIDAFGEWKDLSLHKKHIGYLSRILNGNKAKFLIIGGAGSLYIDKNHTTMLMDTKDFPPEYLDVAIAAKEVLEVLRKQTTFNWVYVSPAAVFSPEIPKSGKYKIIGEEFEVNSNGQSEVGYADYASAMLDIAIDSKYNKERVGVIGL